MPSAKWTLRARAVLVAMLVTALPISVMPNEPNSRPYQPTIPASTAHAEEPLPADSTASPANQESSQAAVALVNYVVLPGETLSELAARYDTTVAKLLEYNPKLSPDNLAAGKLIKVPDENPDATRPRFVWPADGPMTTPFGLPGNSWIGGYHMGLDIGGAIGDYIWAAGEGVIVDTGTNGRGRGYGTYVVVYHRDGWYTLYAHLSSVYRPIGYALRKGEPLGEVGSTGYSDGPHLHFEVWRMDDTQKLDPIQFLP